MKVNNETKVGILATVAITLLVLGFNFLKNDKMFQRGFELHAYYEDIQGLGIGNPIIYNGYRTGSVKTITMDKETGKIDVTFNMEKGLKIPVDSKAIISNSDLLGSKAIKIERGFAKQFVETGGSLTGEIEVSLQDRIAKEILPLKDDVGNLIKQMDRFMAWLNTTMDENMGNKIDKIMDDVGTTTHNFARSSYRVDTLLGTFQSVASNANRMVRDFRAQGEQVSKILGNAATFTDSLSSAATNLKDLIARTDGTVASLEGIMKKVQNGEGTLGKMVYDENLYANINSTIARVDSLVNQIQNDGAVKVELEHRFPLFRKKKED